MMERADAFLATVLDGPAPGIAALAKALDLLAGVYHDTPEAEPFESALAPPPRDEGSMRKRLQERFPYLGLYAGTIHSHDIGDLQEVVWRHDHVGAGDASCHLRFLYEHHWGRHLHDLRAQVHFLQFKH